MRTSFFTWRNLVLAVAVAILAGTGVWLSVARTSAPGQPSDQASPVPPSAGTDGTPKLDLQALPSTVRAPRPANCGHPSLAGASGAWLPDWLDDPSRPSLIADQASRLRLDTANRPG